MERVKKIEAVCREHQVPLAGRGDAVRGRPPGDPVAHCRRAERRADEQNVKWFGHPIPAAFWSEMKANGLIREDAPTPG